MKVVVSATTVMVMTWISDVGDVVVDGDAADNNTDEIAVALEVDSDINYYIQSRKKGAGSQKKKEKMETSMSREGQENLQNNKSKIGPREGRLPSAPSEVHRWCSVDLLHVV